MVELIIAVGPHNMQVVQCGVIDFVWAISVIKMCIQDERPRWTSYVQQITELESYI